MGKLIRFPGSPQEGRAKGRARQGAYSDDSDHPFQGKATSSLSESMQGSSSGQ